MLDDDRLYLQTLDFRALGEREWAELKARLERRARAERSAAVAAMTAAVFAGLGRLTSAVAREWQAYWIAQTRRAAMRKLSSLDDRDLKDIGLRRCEIYTAVYRRNSRRMR